MHVYEAPREEWEEWDNFNKEAELGNVFQTAAFSRAMLRCGMKAGLILAREGNSIVGGAFYSVPFPSGVKRIFNQFFVVSGPVLSNLNDTETLNAILSEIDRKARELGCFSVQLRTPFKGQREIISSMGYMPDENAVSCSFVVGLKDEDAMWKGLNKKTRNGIRKGQKMGVSVRTAKPGKDFNEVHKIHLSRARDIKTMVPMPKDYFSNMHEEVGKDSVTFLAEYQGKPIAESMFLLMGGTISYFNNASLREYQSLNGNSLLVWEIMKWGRRNGYKRLDLYGSPCTPDKNHPEHGLYAFKSGFGGEFCQHMQYYNKTISPVKSAVFRRVLIPLLPIYKRFSR